MTLKEAREAAKLTQQELATLVGVQPSSISMYESGERTPSMPVAKRLCRSLKVTMDDVFNSSSETVSA